MSTKDNSTKGKSSITRLEADQKLEYIKDNYPDFKKEILLRNTGRTHDIAHFAAKQLMLQGEVVVHDHTAVEYPDRDPIFTHNHLKELIEKIMAIGVYDWADRYKIEYRCISPSIITRLPGLLHLILIEKPLKT